MTATPTMTSANKAIHEEVPLDARVFSVIDEIDDDETYQRIVHNIPCGLDPKDTLLIASMLNKSFPPTDLLDVAECLGDGTFTAIVNPDTYKLEWESDSTRYDQADEWTEGDNAFGYRPPDRILLAALQFDGTHIEFIDNPTEEMKLTAVKRSSAAIEYIKNPSDAVRQAASARANIERGQTRAAFAREHGPNVTLSGGAVNDAPPCGEICNCGCSASQDKPTYFVQGIGPLNLFADLLICTVMELNSIIENDVRDADFVHMSELGETLVLSFSSMRHLFSLRDVFLELVSMKGLEGDSEMDFDGMWVITYPSVMCPGFVTWGDAAVVARM